MAHSLSKSLRGFWTPSWSWVLLHHFQNLQQQQEQCKWHDPTTVSSHSKLANNPPTRCQIFFSPAATYKSSKNPQSSKNPTQKKNRLKSLAVVYTKPKKTQKNPPLLTSSTKSSSQQLVFHSADKVLLTTH